MGGPGSGRKPGSGIKGKKTTIVHKGKKITFSEKSEIRNKLHNRKEPAFKKAAAASFKRLRNTYLGKSEGRARKY